MRSADIAARCREIALRVQCSGEWGELAETLTQAATEVERLRLLPSVQEEICAWSVDLHDAREKIKRLEAEVERLRLTPDEILSVKCAEAMLSDLPDGKHHADVLWTLLARLRGDE